MLLGVRSAASGRCVSRRRAPRALPTQGEQSLRLKLCVCARADSSDCGPTRNEYFAGQRTDKLARPMGKASKEPTAQSARNPHQKYSPPRLPNSCCTGCWRQQEGSKAICYSRFHHHRRSEDEA